jgi:ribose transport system permease protein
MSTGALETPPAAETAPAARPQPRRRLTPGDVARRYGLLVAWALVILVFGVLRPETFLTVGNFQTIFGSQAVLVVLTVGLIVPFTVGEFDLSIAGVLSVSLVLVGYLDTVQGWPIGAAIAVALLSGLVVGVINAFIIIVLDVSSIVVTLGTGTLLLGVASGISNTTNGGISSVLVDATQTTIFGLPLVFYYGLALVVVAWYVYSYTPLGRYLYFVGAGRDVALLSGVRVDALRAGSLVTCGFISALAGVLLAGSLGASDPNVGAGYLLPAFAAAFLGSTAIVPGRFNPWGVFVAVYFLITGITGLQLMGLSGWIEQVFYGGSLVLAVSLSQLAARKLRGEGGGGDARVARAG